jgi:hypothetical protein
MIRKVSNFFWQSIFKISPIRNRLAFHVKHRCLNELHLSIPLGYDIYVPWFDPEIGSSFTEIFLEQEYAGIFQFMKPPARWIDLGAFAGLSGSKAQDCTTRSGGFETEEMPQVNLDYIS